MANLLPTPVAAALGLVPAVLDGVRSLPGRAVQIPVIAVSNALSTMDLLRRSYDDLADRGERLIARVSGRVVDAGTDPLGAVDVLEDRIEDIAARTPFAKAYDRTEDALEDVVGRVKQAGEQAASTAGRGARAAGQAAESAARTVERSAERAAGTAERTAEKAADTAERTADKAADTAGRTAEKAADTVDKAADKAADKVADAADKAAGTTPVEEQPKGAPTPAATQPDSTRVDTAASPSVQQAVEEASAGAAAAPLEHDDLPLPDYDHMTLGSLRGRLRSLSVEQLVQIRTYEKAHADRLPVVTMLDNRIAKLASDASARPSGPVSASPAPEQLAVGGAQPSSGVSPATTTAPTINPPSQGDPTNPAQPR